MKHTASWGKSTSINLYGCNKKTLADPEKIKKFVSSVIKKIHMVAHGPTLIERFGSGDLEGYSAMQFIETSSITIHCDEVGGRAFIDIFSCKDFNPDTPKAYACDYFEAISSQSVTLDR